MSRSTRTHSGSKENIQHQCRVLLEGPPLSDPHRMHTSRHGSAEQDLPHQNTDVVALCIWPEHSPRGSLCSLQASRSSSLQAPLSLRQLPGEHCAGVASGRNHFTCNKSRRTNKRQDRLGCLELEPRCLRMESGARTEGLRHQDVVQGLVCKL